MRIVLVPAVMRLLGNRSWYAPPVLRRLHHKFGISEGGEVDAEPRPVPVDA